MSQVNRGARRRFRIDLVLVVITAIFLFPACQVIPPTKSATSVASSAAPNTVAPARPSPTALTRTTPPVATTPGTSTPSSALPTPTVTTSPNGDRNVAPLAKITVSSGDGTAGKAVDGKTNTLWSAGGNAPQTYTLMLDQVYLVDRIQLVVAQHPDGQTTHEVWLGDPSGSLKLYQKLVNTWTSDGQTIDVPVEPAQLVDRVLIRTDASPSFVAWYEIRVLGRPPAPGATASGRTAATPVVVDWPKVAVVGSFNQPTQITNAGDGSNRLFVAERRGVVWIAQGGSPGSKPFLDLSDRVKCCDGEQGFFNLAFPPDFAKKRYFYVSYTSRIHGPVGDTIIARYHLSADPNVADPASEQILLDIPKQTEVHNGGGLAFGPKDGYLYVGVGDGGLQNDPTNEAQSLSSLKGKILRLDTESGRSPYAVPPTNPFVGQANARPEVWALGLRNPWRISFDLQTGDFYIGDVGENDYEEIDFQAAASKGGENYGWHVMEGDHCHLEANCDPRGFTFPVAEYSHQDGCAVIGGTVYRGKATPALQGIYFYADLCSGRVWGLRRAGPNWEANLLTKVPFQVSNIGVDEQGNLYLADFSDGAIFRLTALGASSNGD